MKENKGIIVLKLSTILLLVGIVLFNLNYKSIKTKDINYSKINKIVESILDYEFEELEDDKKEDIKTLVRDTINNTDDDNLLLQCNFILGYIEFNEKEYESSRNRYYTVIRKLDKAKDSRIKIATYYELSRVYLYEEIGRAHV